MKRLKSVIVLMATLAALAMASVASFPWDTAKVFFR